MDDAPSIVSAILSHSPEADYLHLTKSMEILSSLKYKCSKQ